MKKSSLKIASVLMALAIVFTVAFSATAATSVSSCKTIKFLKAVSSSRAVTVYAKDITSGSISAKGIVATAKINKDSVDLKAKAQVSLGSLTANAYYDGKNLNAYLWIFKVNATDILENLGGDIDINSYAADLNDILDMADSDLLSALAIDTQTDTYEKLIVSPVKCITTMLGLSEADVTEAFKDQGEDITGKTDAEIKATVKEMAASGDLLTMLQTLKPSLTQADVDQLVKYMDSTYEFWFSGDNVTNFKITDENGEVTELKTLLPIEIKYIAAGEQDLGYNPPAFSFDITGLVSGLLKSFIG